MGLREQKKDQMRRRLYESAMAMFRARGFEQTRIRDVIEQVQVSEATFFNYFPTKEAVLQQSAAESKRFYGAYLHNLLARPDEPAVARLRELARVVASTFASDREFMATVLAHTNLLFGSADDPKELDLENYSLLAELFRQGQSRREFGRGHDPLQLAEVFNAAQLLTITNWVNRWFETDTGELEPRVLAAVDVVLRGCATKRVPPAAA